VEGKEGKEVGKRRDGGAVEWWGEKVRGVMVWKVRKERRWGRGEMGE
jgi:hypothetical protein